MRNHRSFFGKDYLDEIRLKNISLDILENFCYTIITKKERKNKNETIYNSGKQ